ncbi:hypothetical protein OPV22_006347 [Ensete ventricosum]|uniref:Uncharacterized protein n=1 Tax=Ensete ventricosum TaxID=4639 RepID=A0AAV8RKM8_ENSVE|nr:hypothetical protein OPV22_006347 [Ensete ventricosum]
MEVPAPADGFPCHWNRCTLMGLQKGPKNSPNLKCFNNLLMSEFRRGSGILVLVATSVSLVLDLAMLELSPSCSCLPLKPEV